MSSFVLFAVIFLVSLAFSDGGAGKAFEISVIALAGWLAIFAAGHFIRSPWLVHRDKEQERAAIDAHWGFGIIGSAVILLMFGGIVACGIWWYVNREPKLGPIIIGSADPSAKDAEIKQLQEQVKELTPDQSSLRSRALKAASELELFFRQRNKHEPTCTQTSAMTPEQQRDAIMPCAKYNGETQMLYQQKYAPNIMAMVQEFKGKGMDVLNIENCAPQGWCGISLPVQLRAFAQQLDIRDNRKR